MTDREKVIKGLAAHLGNKSPQCNECPYFNSVDMRRYNDPNPCLLSMMTDALALLKEQEELNDHYQSLLIAYNDMRKEQEPKPIAYTDNPYTGLPVARCPKCGKFARQFHSAIEEETHYCPWCGQAVKWE